MSEQLVRNRAKLCKHREECGGAKPHGPCRECGHCPFDPEAQCEPEKGGAN